MEENIVKLTYKDKEIYLIKTAHVSKNSIEDVNRAYETINPDSICIELDKARFDSIQNKDDKWKDSDITKVIKEGKVGYLLVNIILSSFQKRLAKSLNTNTGGEMLTGIKLAQENNKNLVLADRSVNTTFSRVWNSLGFGEKCKLLTTIVASIFDKEEISEEELQALKQADALDAALQEVGKQFPNVKKTLVDERDMYLAQKIKTAPGNKIIAIIGAAHSLGIEKYLNQDVDTDELDKVVKKKGIIDIIKWAIPLAILFMLLYTIFTNLDTGLDQLKSWVLWNGTASAIGTLLCAGHPLSAIVAFAVAPFTSLNPILSAGLFSALTESMLRKPRVKDFEALADDTDTFKGFFKNKVTKILLIFVFTNIFSSLATFISGAGILKTFIQIFTK